MRAAHLPAYELCGFKVNGIFDSRPEVSAQIAIDFEIAIVANSLSELVSVAPEDVIFDIAVPGRNILEVLAQLPDNAYVLIQKPLGETLQQAKEIVAAVESKNLHAAVNFQLRWAPYSLALKSLLATNVLGEIHDVDVKINVHTPWANWTFLEDAPRMEMVYHSIHYLDFIRHIMGEPRGVQARSIRDPRSPKLESSRSTIILDYGDFCRATVHTYHGHVAGPKHQESYLKAEGTTGVARFQMGLNMDYPKGGPDIFEYWLEGDEDWTNVPLEGSWFPHAFRGPMAAMMTWCAGGPAPSTEVHDALITMKLVEAAYKSSDIGGICPESV